MTLLHIFLGFLISNLLGYGGGPATIPLMYEEIVNHYKWLNDTEFSQMLALGNALPGPIATNIATYVGYDVYGWWGVLIALFATIFPSAFALILLLKILHRHRQSLFVKGMTLLVQPVIAVMMLALTWKMSANSFSSIGIVQSLVIGLIAVLALIKFKIHPAFMICAAFIYGGLVLPHI
ncbi:chromate transporter [Neobacillus ginsengisoli]|uniref:Chromate transporter n=1 Tax=Neobacillus ginsengisoli TaxID=904295 RepID=A0ABT9XYJ3_9BACI|nr:chromate transporter [Neobacillus ginsengisoli]MDQ0200642.1 chromate transporter [Neobacillus ginsengisoli]